MKFIRKNGRIIPIRQKADGNIDQRHISKNDLAVAASKKNPTLRSSLFGVAMGAAAGSMIGKAVGAGQGLGALVGGALSLGTPSFVTKKEAANGLRKKYLKRKK